MAQRRKGAIAIRSGASRQGPQARRGLRGAWSASHRPVPGRTDSDFAAVRPVQKTQFTVKVWLFLPWAPGGWTATVLAPGVASAPIVRVAPGRCAPVRGTATLPPRAPGVGLTVAGVGL